MADEQPSLGGRLPLLDPDSLAGDQKRLYDLLGSTLVSWATASGFKGKTEDGRLIGPFNPNLHSPDITPAWIGLVEAESKHTSLSKRAHEVVILSVGAIWKSPYELYSHSTIARGVGLPEAAIVSLVAGQTSEHLSPDEVIAFRFTRQLVGDRKVEASLYHEAEAAFGRAGVVDMVYLIGIYLATCAMLNAFEIPAPE